MTLEIFKTLLAKDGIVPDKWRIELGIIQIQVLGVMYFSHGVRWEVFDQLQKRRLGGGSGEDSGLQFLLRCVRSKQFLLLCKIGDQVDILGDMKRRCVIDYIHPLGHFVSFRQKNRGRWSTSIHWFDLSDRVRLVKQ